MKKIIIITILAFSGLMMFSCEDPAPFDYEEAFVIEGYIIVGEKIKNIKVMRTQPLEEVFDYEAGLIKDANVSVSQGDNVYNLTWDNSLQTYIYDSETVEVLPKTEYNLRVELQDGKVFTGTTTTPDTFSWVRRPKEFIQYPIDTLNLPENPEYELEWSDVEDFDFFLITVVSNDTLEYGKYLDPPTEELNRRVYNGFQDQDDEYREISTTNLIANTKTPNVWLAYKWFGETEVIVQCPDFNWLLWAIDAGGAADPNLSSVEGENVYGAFGSASVIRDTSFVLKNQP